MAGDIKIWTLSESASWAAQCFGVFDPFRRTELVPTGVHTIDSAIGGISPGDAVVIGGTTGVGKSTVTVAMAFAQAELGRHVGLVVLEDAADVYGARALASIAGVNSIRMRRGDIGPDDAARVERGIEALKGVPISLVYAAGFGLKQVIESAKALCESGCKVLYLDYLQAISGVSDNRRQEITTAMRSIHAVGAAYGVPTIFVSQLRRIVDEDGNPKRPSRYHLKESGDIENAARLIILLARDKNSNIVGWVEKSTSGAEGTKFTMARDESGALREVRYNPQPCMADKYCMTRSVDDEPEAVIP